MTSLDSLGWKPRLLTMKLHHLWDNIRSFLNIIWIFKNACKAYSLHKCQRDRLGYAISSSVE